MSGELAASASHRLIGKRPHLEGGNGARFPRERVELLQSGVSRLKDHGVHDPTSRWLRRAHVALVETVLTLGGGERFDPREGTANV